MEERLLTAKCGHRVLLKVSSHDGKLTQRGIERVERMDCLRCLGMKDKKGEEHA